MKTCRITRNRSTRRRASRRPEKPVDLSKFPFTTKDDLRANYPYGMFAVPMERIVRIHASSGTTGKPTVVGYTALDIRTWADVCARSIYASGGRRGMKVHVAFGYGLFTRRPRRALRRREARCPAIPVSGGMTERQIKLIVDFQPEIIAVTPSYMLAIPGRVPRAGRRSGHIVAADRHLRRRAVDQTRCGPRSKTPSTCTRSISTASPR